MKLLAVGDSFTYGEELSDLNNAWPFLLGKQLGYEVTNLARPGKSNDYMVRTIVEHASNYDLIIVAWSHYARVEFADEHGVYDIWPGNKGNMFTGDISYRKELIEYISRYHDDKHLYKTYLLKIILIQSYLAQLDKRFLMLDAFGNTKARKLDTNKLSNLVNSEKYIGWPSESMMEWTFGCEQGSYGHFLNNGHTQVANKIYEHIRHLGWIS